MTPWLDRDIGPVLALPRPRAVGMETWRWLAYFTHGRMSRSTGEVEHAPTREPREHRRRLGRRQRRGRDHARTLDEVSV